MPELERLTTKPSRLYKDISVVVPRGADYIGARLAQEPDSQLFVSDNYYAPEVTDNIKPVEFNGTIANLIHAQLINGGIELTMNVTNFSMHKASLRNVPAGERFQQTGEGMPQGIITTARIRDNQGQQVISLRQDRLVGTVGGMFSPLENIEYFGFQHTFNPYAVIILELWEEIGIWSTRWCEQNGNWEYLIVKPQSEQDVIQNEIALFNILNNTDIRLSDVITRGVPINVPLLIFDITLPNNASELSALHRANRNDELKALVAFDTNAADYLANVTMTTELQCCYPQEFPTSNNPAFVATSINGSQIEFNHQLPLVT